MYGYWGKAAKKSLEHWQIAHRTAGPLFLIGGVLSLTSGYYFEASALTYARSINLFVGLGLGILTIVVTERKLKHLD